MNILRLSRNLAAASAALLCLIASGAHAQHERGVTRRLHDPSKAAQAEPPAAADEPSRAAGDDLQPTAAPSRPPAAAAGSDPSNAFGLIEPATPATDPGATDHSSFAGDAWGEEGNGPATVGPLSFRVLLQPRYEHTFAQRSSSTLVGYPLREAVLVHDGDGYSLQRFFFRIAADPTPMLSFKAILDFAKLRGSSVSNVLKQAYAALKPVPKHVEIVAGIFKLPYSILELDPVARYELSDLGSADNLIKALGFGGRDAGIELMLAPLPKPRYLRLIAGAFRGHAKDEHASPLGALGGRIESKPFKWLRLGIDVVYMPFSQDYKRPFETSSKELLPNPPDALYPREQQLANYQWPLEGESDQSSASTAAKFIIIGMACGVGRPGAALFGTAFLMSLTPVMELVCPTHRPEAASGDSPKAD